MCGTVFCGLLLLEGCPALNSLLDPVDRISDYFIPAVFIKDLMEESAVNFHLFIFGRCRSKEIISIFYTYKSVFFSVKHEDRIGKVLDSAVKPVETAADGVAQACGKGLCVIGILSVPVYDLGYGADACAQLIGKQGVRIQVLRNAGNQAAVVLRQSAAGDQAAQPLIRILCTV